jgi:hypothetical protein
MTKRRLMERRDFIKKGALGSVALMTSNPLLVAGGFWQAGGEGAGDRALSGEQLVRAFHTPPATAKPYTWWHWLDGNVTKEGITADLESMQRVGLGGAHIFNVSYQIPPGPIQYMTPEWLEMMGHAAQEAKRLGLQLAMHNCSGWSSSGGPWITPGHGMQKVVWTETQVKGPINFKGTIPSATVEKYQGFCRDIAVLACRTPEAERTTLRKADPKITTDGTGLTSDRFDTADEHLDLLFPTPSDATPHFILLEFAEPYAARSLMLDYTAGHGDVRCELQTSDDGRTFQTISTTVIKIKGTPSIGVPESKARFYRLRFTGTPAPDGTPLNLTGLDLLNGYRLPDWPTKAGFALWAGSDTFVPAWDERAPEGTAYELHQVVDVSHLLKGDRLEWSVPEGNWTILRFGYAPNGRINTHPEKAGAGLEVDKMNPAALDAHFDFLIQAVLKEVGPLTGESFTTLLIDSYEVGPQNWTPRFGEDFKRLRGYDLTPYLPAMTGRVIGSNDVSERFLWDVRRTIADLYAENYYGHFRELCQKRGLNAAFEAYTGPFSIMDCSDHADLPMGEFWTGNGYRRSNTRNRLVVSSGHLTGKLIVGAESYTSSWGADRFTQDPYSLKSLGDFQFSEGINRFIFHEFALQPWLDVTPGMTMGPWGLHLERTITWWEQGRAWMHYLARCQYLLQVGGPVSDVLVFAGEDAEAESHWGEATEPVVPEGYDFEFVNRAQLMKATMKDGRIVLPIGLTFKVIVIPEANYCTPGILKKLAELVQGGAVLVGPAPVRSPSLTDYPACDTSIHQSVAELWGNVSGAERTVGRGKVYGGRPLLQDVLEKLDISPDFTFTHGGTAEIVYKHRMTPAADIYFVSNQSNEEAALQCSFRVVGKVPEFWHADTGATELAPAFREEGGRTVMPVRLDPSGSVFVVFRDGVTADHAASVVRKEDLEARRGGVGAFDLTAAGGQLVVHAWEPGEFTVTTAKGRTLRAGVASVASPLVLNEDWEVSFPAKLGAPASIHLQRLMNLSEHPVPGVRYFSGTATYVRDVDVTAEMMSANRDLYLDLGTVKNIAELKINGVDLGILWKPPFRTVVTAALRPGKNRIEVRLTNLWANRLIGDEQLPDDREWIAIPGRGWRLKEWPAWFAEHKPRPTARIAFATWRFYSKGDPLPESGLIGPVQLLTVEKVGVRV